MGGRPKIFVLFIMTFAIVSVFLWDSMSLAQLPSQDVEYDYEYDEYQDEFITIQDPYESFNRKMYAFNDKAYHYVLKPVGQGYDFVVRSKVRKGIRNFFTNVRMPVRFFNCLFQGKFKGAGVELGRFLVNTGAGGVGLTDPAKDAFGWELKDEDFGQTLATYGMGSGPFIMWPLLGPSSIRDTIGFIGDAALNPLTYLGIFVDPEEISLGVGALNRMNEISVIGDNYERLMKSAVDPYIAIQDAYLQNRDKKIKE